MGIIGPFHSISAPPPPIEVLGDPEEIIQPKVQRGQNYRVTITVTVKYPEGRQ